MRKKIIEASGLNENSSDYEKAITLHDEIAYMVEYNHAAASELMEAQASGNDELIKEVSAKYPDVHNAYGALIDKCCVCDGYAKAYQYLLYKVGIVSHIVSGYGGKEPHAWNLVKLDGAWYYTDLTWDDQSSGVYHSYFDVTTEKLEYDHVINDLYYTLPECTATLDNYFEKNDNSLSIDRVAEQLNNGIYATIYAPGKSMDEVLGWYSSNKTSINEKVDRTGKSMIITASEIGGEYHISFFKSSGVTADKDFHVAVNTENSGDLRLMQVFYDKNNTIMEVKLFPIEDENTIIQLHPEIWYKGYKKVKYMLWDSVNGLRPAGSSEDIAY